MNFITINGLLVFNVLCYLYSVCIWTCLVPQMIASKYLNDEGEAESILNSEWAKIGKSLLVA